jgi:hypothetical protein
MRFARDLQTGTWTRPQMRTPGYPIFLILTGATERPTKLLFVATLALYMGTVVVLLSLMRSLGVGDWWLAAFCAVSLLPIYVEPSAYVLTESISQWALCVTFALLLAWLRDGRWPMLGCATLMCLVSAMIRPTYEFLAPVLAAALVAGGWLGWMRRPARPRWIASLALLALVPLVGLQAYAMLNYMKFGFWSTSTVGGLAVSSKMATVLEYLPEEYAQARDMMITERDKLLVKPFDDHNGEGYIHRALPVLLRQFGGDELKTHSAIQHMNRWLLVHKPLSYVAVCVKAMGLYWMPNDYPLATGGSVELRAMWALLQLALTGLFLVQGCAIGGFMLLYAAGVASNRIAGGQWSSSFGRIAAAYLIANSIILYNWLVSSWIGIGQPRYRMPTDLLVLLTTVLGFVLWRKVLELMVVQLDGSADSAEGKLDRSSWAR